jgi:hypothetical protein
LENRIVPTLLGQQLFPLDYPWNQNISNAPVAANSGNIIAHIGPSIGLHPDWGADNPVNGANPLYGIPFNVVHGNITAKVNVTIDNYPGESDIVPVPIPANGVIEGDFQNGPNPNGGGYNPNQRGDSHLIVWDEDNNIAYELFGVTRPTDPTLFPNTSNVELPHTDGLWHAAQETVWNMGTDSFRTLGATSADAAGLSILAGLVRPDEGLTVAQGGQGAINHALRMTLPSGDINPQYIYPASHMVSTSQGANNLPLGSRLRLANTTAINNLINAMPPESQIIARAMQQYGLIVADIGSAMYVTGASASVDANNNISLTWNMNDIFASNGLEALNAGDFEVVNLTPVVTGLSSSSGSAGNTITITGQNFSGAAGHLSVFFGTTPAGSVTVISDTQLSVVVPNASGTVSVTVQSGVNETDNISSSPNANVNAPIFGYGTSATTSSDIFTYSGTVVRKPDDLVGRISQNGQWWVGLSNGSNSFSNKLFATWSPAINWADVVTGDFNGDGRTDIAGRDPQTGNWWVGISNGSSFTTSRWTTWSSAATWVDIKVGDFTGSGRDDILGRYQQTGQWWLATSTSSFFTNTLWAIWSTAVTWVDVLAGDFNHDGKMDITGRVLQNGSWWTGISNGSLFNTSLWGSWSPAVTWVDVNVGDFNGDGKADLVGRISQNGQWWVAQSTGSSFTNSLWATWNPAATWVDVKVGDFTGNGLSDITGRFLEGGEWYTARSTGSSFVTTLWGAWNPNVTWVDVQVGDFNADGKEEIVGRYLQGGSWWAAISTGSSFNTTLWTSWSPAVTWAVVRTGAFV